MSTFAGIRDRVADKIMVRTEVNKAQAQFHRGSVGPSTIGAHTAADALAFDPLDEATAEKLQDEINKGETTMYYGPDARSKALAGTMSAAEIAAAAPSHVYRVVTALAISLQISDTEELALVMDAKYSKKDGKWEPRVRNNFVLKEKAGKEEDLREAVVRALHEEMGLDAGRVPSLFDLGGVERAETISEFNQGDSSYKNFFVNITRITRMAVRVKDMGALLREVNECIGRSSKACLTRSVDLGIFDVKGAAVSSHVWSIAEGDKFNVFASLPNHRVRMTDDKYVHTINALWRGVFLPEVHKHSVDHHFESEQDTINDITKYMMHRRQHNGLLLPSPVEVVVAAIRAIGAEYPKTAMVKPPRESLWVAPLQWRQ